MTDIGWRDAYAVGDALIDGQHRAFFDETAAVLRALAEGASKQVVVGFYRDFLVALVTHFRDEEALMERVEYPGLEDHRGEHAVLADAVTGVESLLLTSSSGPELSMVVDHLFGALVDHLLTVDMRYKSWVMVARGS